ncbi:MAG TPA: DUF4276 family protein [Anaerolineae bacterium]
MIDKSQEGALHTLIRRELEAAGYQGCHFVQRHPSLHETQKGKLQTGHGILNRKYVAQTVIAWQPHEIDIVVWLVDADDLLSQRTRELTGVIDTVRKNHLDENDQPLPDRSTGGLAIKNFDTWLLADTGKVEEILEVELPSGLPRNLEVLPGNREARDHAKNILDSRIDQSRYLAQEKEGLRKLRIRWQLAFVVDLSQIRQRCPQGYPGFIEAVSEAAKAATAT